MKRFAIISCAIFALFGYMLYSAYTYVINGIPDMYRQEAVAGLIIDHLRRTETKWPTSWDDLEVAYKARTGQRRCDWTFAELRDRVDVDFSADPAVLFRTATEEKTKPFRVVRLRSGRRNYWEVAEPNQMIWRYLNRSDQERAKVPPQQQAHAVCRGRAVQRLPALKSRSHFTKRSAPRPASPAPSAGRPL